MKDLNELEKYFDDKLQYSLMLSRRDDVVKEAGYSQNTNFQNFKNQCFFVLNSATLYLCYDNLLNLFCSSTVKEKQLFLYCCEGWMN